MGVSYYTDLGGFLICIHSFNHENGLRNSKKKKKVAMNLLMTHPRGVEEDDILKSEIRI